MKKRNINETSSYVGAAEDEGLYDAMGSLIEAASAMTDYELSSPEEAMEALHEEGSDEAIELSEAIDALNDEIDSVEAEAHYNKLGDEEYFEESYKSKKKIMKKIVRLTENDLTRIVKKVIKEQEDIDFDQFLDADGNLDPSMHSTEKYKQFLNNLSARPNPNNSTGGTKKRKSSREQEDDFDQFLDADGNLDPSMHSTEKYKQFLNNISDRPNPNNSIGDDDDYYGSFDDSHKVHRNNHKGDTNFDDYDEDSFDTWDDYQKSPYANDKLNNWEFNSKGKRRGLQNRENEPEEGRYWFDQYKEKSGGRPFKVRKKRR